MDIDQVLTKAKEKKLEFSKTGESEYFSALLKEYDFINSFGLNLSPIEIQAFLVSFIGEFDQIYCEIESNILYKLDIYGKTTYEILPYSFGKSKSFFYSSTLSNIKSQIRKELYYTMPKYANLKVPMDEPNLLAENLSRLDRKIGILESGQRKTIFSKQKIKYYKSIKKKTYRNISQLINVRIKDGYIKMQASKWPSYMEEIAKLGQSKSLIEERINKTIKDIYELASELGILVEAKTKILALIDNAKEKSKIELDSEQINLSVESNLPLVNLLQEIIFYYGELNARSMVLIGNSSKEEKNNLSDYPFEKLIKEVYDLASELGIEKEVREKIASLGKNNGKIVSTSDKEDLIKYYTYLLIERNKKKKKQEEVTTLDRIEKEAKLVSVSIM